MASSQETVPVSSQESQEMTSSQGTAPASSQEMTSASQESMSQDTASMPSQDSTTDTTILDATGRVPMEDEACLEGPTLKCTLDEEWALLNPLFTESLDQLEDVPLGYLNVLVARINQIRKVKVSQMPVPSPRALPGLPPLGIGQPAPIPTSVSGATASLSEAIHSATSNLGTTVPRPSKRKPMHPPDQAETDPAVRVLECLNKTTMHLYIPLCATMLHCAPLCYTMCLYAPLCYTMRLYAPLCATMLHYAPLCATMLHYAPLCPTMCHYAPLCVSKVINMLIFYWLIHITPF